MRRGQVAPRPDWRAQVEAQGMLFHGLERAPEPAYWAEGTYYALSPAEVDALERATAELHQMCLEAAQAVITQHRYAALGIPALAIPLIEASWEADPPSLYGRFDLALDPAGTPRLLEYNADTPTSLLEAAVIQWTWLERCFPGHDQFNSIHERLIEAWRSSAARLDGRCVHFACVESVEDEMTVGYLRDTAQQAGLETVSLRMEELGWDAQARRFVDLEQRPIRNLFKLYPWESLLLDAFGAHVAEAPAQRWLEPAWKMLLSSKGILAVLWELFPGHPLLLPASLELDGSFSGGWVRKPLHGREGSNVRIEAPGVQATTTGPYDGDRFIYQAYVDLGEYDGWRPVLGAWVIGGEPAGLGIRESTSHVTDTRARFVPHLIAQR